MVQKALFMIKNRLIVLDALRGLAALSVVLFHYSHQYYVLFPEKYNFIFDFDLGYFGVQVFFVISGFVIFMTLNKTERPRDFFVSRIARLYPVYWSAVIVTFIIVLIFGLDGQEVSFSDFFFNFLMIHNLFNIPNVDGVYWTLLYEIKFYFLMFVVYYFTLLKRIDYISFIMILLTVSHYYFAIDSFPLKIFYYLFILKYLSFFIAGIMFYKIYDQSANLFTYIVLICSLISNIVIVQNEYEKVILTLILYPVFFFLVKNKLNFLAIKPLVYLGTISYSLYLVHQNIGYVIIKFGFLYDINIEIITLLAFIISLLLATVMTFFIEQPALNKIRTFYNVYKIKNKKRNHTDDK